MSHLSLEAGKRARIFFSLLLILLLQEYHKEIDQLKAELQAARDKDGVFLPAETYQEQIKENARKEEEIKGLTKELKAKEQELEHFMVR